MIPIRIALDGFLCYREKQELVFDESPLWMLSGRNGVGKSAIFDALTYALFGQHRNGAQNAGELIHKDRDGFTVEFDFALGDQRYRARRTLRRTASGDCKPTQQLLRYGSAADGIGRWEPVPDTTKKIDFDRWVQQHIGLNYQTFTSSVLLMQGQAEKLIGATNRERFDVLKAIVDLERFERLHEKADQHRKACERKAEAAQCQLTVIPDVTGAMLAQAQQATAEAQARSQQATAEAHHLQTLEAQAAHWAKIQAQMAKHRQWLTETEGLLREADAIERDLDRFQQLQAVLPLLERAAAQRGLLEGSLRKSSELESERQALADDLQRRDEEIARCQQQWDEWKQAIEADAAKQRALAERLAKLGEVVARVEIYEKQRHSFEQIKQELAQFPKDLSETAAREKAECERLTALERALVPLRRLCRHRDELRQAHERAAAAAAAARAASARAAELQSHRDRLANDLDAAERERAAAHDRAAGLRSLRDQAIAQLREFGALEGVTTCHACGQPLTPQHFAQERSRRQQAIEALEHQYNQAQEGLDAATRKVEAIRAEKQAIDAQSEDTKKEAEAQQTIAAQARKDAQRHAEHCLDIYHELNEPLRARISPAPPTDWLTTTYPTCDDLETAHHTVQGLEAARRRADKAERELARYNQLCERARTLHDALAELAKDLPERAADLIAENARLSEENEFLKRNLDDRRAREETFPEALDRLGREREAVRKQIETKERKLGDEVVRREGYQQTIEQIRLSLPEAWRDRVNLGDPELRDLKRERDALQSQRIGERAEVLRQARLDMERRRRELADLEAQLAAIPEEARQDPALLCQRRVEAQAECQRRQEELLDARRREDRLRDGHAQRQYWETVLGAAQEAQRTAEVLARLLDRHHLQRHLVRRAERQIVAISNGILDRLSGGRLRLELRPEPAGAKGDEALDLVVYNASTDRTPIGVGFLSGSQKFRVAVSLALGIGQFASRQHRPIESVIIDEGFGCLDREGRQTMIQELQNLRNQLRRILLVSHQEEFADAFANGYRLELCGDTTVATRSHP
jgi:exonuclease SbcC